MSNIWEQRPLVLNVPFPGNAGQIVRDLPVRGKISALVFESLWFNQAGGDNTLNPLDMITQIEIIHRGSEVIKAMSGIQHAGVAWRRGFGVPYQMNFGNAGMWQDGVMTIPFGRYPYDREYGLTLDNLVNPQIRITYNSAYAASGDGAGGFQQAPAAPGTWSIRMLYAPEEANFRGYIKTSVIDTWAIVAGATNFTEMPKNYKWPRMYLYMQPQPAPAASMNMIFNLALLELQADNRAWVPITLDSYSLRRLDDSEFGQPRLCRFLDNVNGIGILLIPSVFDSPWDAWTQSNQAVAMELRLQQGLFDPIMDFVNTAATDAGKIWETGHGFGRMYAVPFCPPNQEADIDNMSLNSTEFGRITVETTAVAAPNVPAQHSIILEELVYF